MTDVLNHSGPRIPLVDRKVAMRVAAGIFAVAAIAMLVVLALANPSGAAVRDRAFRIAKAASGGFSDAALRAANAEMDPAMLALAQRYDPSLAHPATNLTLSPPDAALNPEQGPFGMTAQKAALANAQMPFSTDPNPAARPFSLASASAFDRERAIQCMTQAVYYEAGFEPLEGQRGVAQVIINRMRHPAFPKTICGVVFQGANLTTGCQFSFTCDGALNRPPVAWAWQRAHQVATAALGGYVMKAVGGATHYHADYVVAYWAPRLFKVHQVGAHIFYRWPGSWGLPAAFSGRYAGVEMPGVDPGGDPNRIDLNTLKLAGLEGAADAARQAGKDSASFTVASLGVETRPAATIAAPVIAPEPAPETAKAEPPALVVVEINRKPQQRPHLAMPD